MQIKLFLSHAYITLKCSPSIYLFIYLFICLSIYLYIYLFIYLQYKKELVDAFSENVLPYFENGQLKPIIDSVFDFGDIAEAHKVMEKSTNTGKIIVKVLNEKDEL